MKSKDTVIGRSRHSPSQPLQLPTNQMKPTHCQPVTAACGHLLGQLKITHLTLSGGLKAE